MTSLTDEQIDEVFNDTVRYLPDELHTPADVMQVLSKVRRALLAIQASPIPGPIAFDREFVRKEGLRILQRWNDPDDKYSVWDAARDCARLATPELGEDK